MWSAHTAVWMKSSAGHGQLPPKQNVSLKVITGFIARGEIHYAHK